MNDCTEEVKNILADQLELNKSRVTASKSETREKRRKILTGSDNANRQAIETEKNIKAQSMVKAAVGALKEKIKKVKATVNTTAKDAADATTGKGKGKATDEGKASDFAQGHVRDPNGTDLHKYPLANGGNAMSTVFVQQDQFEIVPKYTGAKKGVVKEDTQNATNDSDGYNSAEADNLFGIGESDGEEYYAEVPESEVSVGQKRAAASLLEGATGEAIPKRVAGATLAVKADKDALKEILDAETEEVKTIKAAMETIKAETTSMRARKNNLKSEQDALKHQLATYSTAFFSAQKSIADYKEKVEERVKQVEILENTVKELVQADLRCKEVMHDVQSIVSMAKNRAHDAESARLSIMLEKAMTSAKQLKGMDPDEEQRIKDHWILVCKNGKKELKQLTTRVNVKTESPDDAGGGCASSSTR